MFIRLSYYENPKKCYCNTDNILYFESVPKGTFLVFKDKADAIFVKESPEEIMSLIASVQKENIR